MIDVSDLKSAADGRWREILTAVGGLPEEAIDGNHYPCPLCGGTDRFRLLDASTGAVLCNQCFRERNGDGIAAIQWMLGITFAEACDRIAEYLGLPRNRTSRSQMSGDELLDRYCKLKHISPEAFRRYGVEVVREGKRTVLRAPMFDANGAPCSHCDFGLSGNLIKGLFGRGKPAGLFLPHADDGSVRLPKAGEMWLIVEGVKDAAALAAMGFLAAGLPGNELRAPFARLFRRVTCVLMPDLDEVSLSGVDATTKRLERIAKAVVVARLPGEISPTKGKDVRDVLGTSDGERQVRQAINDALATPETAEPQGSFIDMSTVATRWMRDFEDDKRPVIYPTGLPWELTPGGVLLLGGGPGAGKSTLALQAVVDALRNDTSLRATFCCVEMTPAQMLERVVAMLAGVPYLAVRLRGELLLERERELIREACTQLRDEIGTRWVFVQPPFDMANVCAVTRQHASHIIVVDYVQRIFPEQDTKLELRLALNRSLDLCRDLAMEGRAVLALSSLRRRDNRGGYDQATITDFKESGEAEYSADDAYILTRDRNTKMAVQVKCVKRRYAVPCDFELIQAPSLRFSVLEPPGAETTAQFRDCEEDDF